MADPYELHLQAIKIILRYVNATMDYGIHYHKNDDVKLVTLVMVIREATYMIGNLH